MEGYKLANVNEEKNQFLEEKIPNSKQDGKTYSISVQTGQNLRSFSDQHSSKTISLGASFPGGKSGFDTSQVAPLRVFSSKRPQGEQKKEVKKINK